MVVSRQFRIMAWAYIWLSGICGFQLVSNAWFILGYRACGSLRGIMFTLRSQLSNHIKQQLNSACQICGLVQNHTHCFGYSEPVHFFI